MNGAHAAELSNTLTVAGRSLQDGDGLEALAEGPLRQDTGRHHAADRGDGQEYKTPTTIDDAAILPEIAEGLRRRRLRQAADVALAMKSSLRSSLRKRLEKKAKKGFRGYPIGSLAFYGPDDRMATKMVASIVQGEREEDIVEMRKWFASGHDVRNDQTFAEEVWAFFAAHGVRSIVMPDRIIGCPHEEGIDYEGPICPQCPFWANRDRWTGEIIH